jgi:membrane protease YdiL (CAAX protease family)
MSSPGAAGEPPVVPPPPGQTLWAGAVIYLVLAVAGLVWIGVQQGGLPTALLVRPERALADVALGLMLAAALVAAWEPVHRLLPLARRLEERIRLAFGPLGRDEAIGLALLSGIAEETFFRGAMQEAWGLLPATLVFAVLHTGRGRETVLWFAYALVAGLLLGLLWEWRGSLLAPVVAHAAANGWQLYRLLVRAPAATR